MNRAHNQRRRVESETQGREYSVLSLFENICRVYTNSVIRLTLEARN